MKYVYVAGPMSKGPLIDHVRNAIVAGNEIRRNGGVPYLPQLSILWDLHTPHHYEDWMVQDFAWIERCDCLVRLPGESSGADREVEFAKKLLKPVFFGVAEWIEGIAVPVLPYPRFTREEIMAFKKAGIYKGDEGDSGQGDKKP